MPATPKKQIDPGRGTAAIEIQSCLCGNQFQPLLNHSLPCYWPIREFPCNPEGPTRPVGISSSGAACGGAPIAVASLERSGLRVKRVLLFEFFVADHISAAAHIKAIVTSMTNAIRYLRNQASHYIRSCSFRKRCSTTMPLFRSFSNADTLGNASAIAAFRPCS
ncbi:MAG: hypothetical protein JWS10_4172 [Cypionkella sp.]|nr:hypothetical protein [Cypionkella sp.]